MIETNNKNDKCQLMRGDGYDMNAFWPLQTRYNHSNNLLDME